MFRPPLVHFGRITVPHLPGAIPRLPNGRGLAGISIARHTNGLALTHVFHVKPSQTFVFHDPKKMVSHLKRTLNSEWLHPDENIAKRADRDIDL